MFDGSLGEDPQRDKPSYHTYVLQRAEIDPAKPDKLAEDDWKNVTPAKDLVWQQTMPEVVDDALRVPSLTAPLPPLVSGIWGESATHPKLGAAAAPAAPAADKPDPRFEDEPAAAPPTPTAPAGIEYRLCRFFDFNVEPMKKYRYRVKVDLANPNFGLPLAILVHPKGEQAEFVETDWSNPTGTVAIPDRYGVLSNGVAENSRSYDPRVAIVATAIDPQEGIEAATSIPVQRASVVNTVAESVEAVDPRDGTIRVLNNVTFHTDIIVVDIYGGRPLSKRSMSAVSGPVEVLVMDPQGNLRVRNELDDHALVEARLPEEEPSSKAKSEDHKEGDEIPNVDRLKRSRASTAAGK